MGSCIRDGKNSVVCPLDTMDINIKPDIFCYTVSKDHLYIFGAIYKKNITCTRFIEQKLIVFNHENYNVYDFKTVNIYSSSYIAKHNLLQFGYRYNYSREILLLKAENSSIYGLNYREILNEKMLSLTHNGKTIPSLPFKIACTEIRIDKCEGSLSYTNIRLKINTNNNILMGHEIRKETRNEFTNVLVQLEWEYKIYNEIHNNFKSPLIIILIMKLLPMGDVDDNGFDTSNMRVSFMDPMVDFTMKIFVWCGYTRVNRLHSCLLFGTTICLLFVTTWIYRCNHLVQMQSFGLLI